MTDLWDDIDPATGALAERRYTSPSRCTEPRESRGDTQVTLLQTKPVPVWALALR